MSSPPLTQLLGEFLLSQSRQPLVEELTDCSPLLDLGIVDSVVVVALASFIEEELAVRVPDEGIPVAKLASLRTLAAWVRELPAEAGR
jgi:acyl carrier protein